ncbi:MAG: pyruvate ferredoxin oxidoreductase [Candidatus Omnitrophica bacterium]|nr:pyruvate ferredoxin oxidoreductase [Candidatus Omnitrophota bacterium]
MKTVKALTGNDAVSYAMKQINPDVVAAYPITPQTSIVEKFSDYVANGEVDTEMILVESEHSAMSACVGSSAAGARTMTATSSQGLALMWEVVYIAAGLRLPIVMPIVNRALSAPINIHCDHSDVMGIRDSGWIHLFCENAQETYENTIQAIRIAEHPDVQLPVSVNLDGFIISHEVANVEIYDDKPVKDFVGAFRPRVSALNLRSPVTVGPLDLQDYYFEHRRQVADAMVKSLNVIKEINAEFNKKFGRLYKVIEGYRLEDADACIVGLGSTMGTLKDLVDNARKAGKKIGFLKITVFRPFPKEDIVSALKGLKAIAVLDRADSVNAMGGPLFGDIRCALYGASSAPVINYIYGLGGRELTEQDINKIIDDTLAAARTGKTVPEPAYIGVRE